MESLKLLPEENPLLESCPLPPPHNELWLCYLVAGSFSCSLLPLFQISPCFMGAYPRDLAWRGHPTGPAVPEFPGRCCPNPLDPGLPYWNDPMALVEAGSVPAAEAQAWRGTDARKERVLLLLLSKKLNLHVVLGVTDLRNSKNMMNFFLNSPQAQGRCPKRCQMDL